MNKVKVNFKVNGKQVTLEVDSKERLIDTLRERLKLTGVKERMQDTPGMIMSAKALINNNPNPTREEIKTAIDGNICRCTGYQQIIEAVESVAKESDKNV